MVIQNSNRPRNYWVWLVHDVELAYKQLVTQISAVFEVSTIDLSVMETSRLGLLLTAALLATASFAEGNRRPFRSIKAPKGERDVAS